MAFWVATLARLDLHATELGRLTLYILGLVLTFNMGRDITLMTLYPFVFGNIFIRWWSRRIQQSNVLSHPNAASRRRRKRWHRDVPSVPSAARADK